VSAAAAGLLAPKPRGEERARTSRLHQSTDVRRPDVQNRRKFHFSLHTTWTASRASSAAWNVALLNNPPSSQCRHNVHNVRLHLVTLTNNYTAN